ncbi:site-2 protease family protein [Azospirillum doebereinerae]|uniref:site-2 protease family protein n=1 Tax=Azospirillum doebereinerae TaxID=92933 RepID=UPI00384F9187
MRNRYFRIGPEAFALIAHWHHANPRAIAAAVADNSLFEPTAQDIMGFYQFLVANNLTVTVDIAFLARQGAARHTGWFWWLVHNYLFFRIPLVRPDRFLSATVGLVAPLYSRGWMGLVLLTAVLAGLLVARQWDAFLHTFQHFFSPEGLALYGVTLLGTKICHELGHAYTAKRFGCRVPTMGVAFLVMWPVLYTDTTDAWRLVSRRQRLAVGAAGMLTELMIAVFATLAWSFLPDGPLRSAAYFLATVSWITTLAINLSPFMRFDGYYLLSDALDVPNLQERAFAMARWKLREWLFGLGMAPPEQMPAARRRILLAYSYVTWLYRLMLFLGIALLVYHVAIKVLGILLFAIEIGWFVARPFLNETKAWWGLRDRFHVNLRTGMTLAGLAAAVGLTLLPVTSTVSVPVVWRASGFATVYAPFPARLEEALVARGQSVVEGEPLFRLTAPDLEGKLRQAELRIAWMQEQIARLTASREQLDRVRAMEEDLAAALAERQGLLDSRNRLVVRAPLSGTVRDMEDALTPRPLDRAEAAAGDGGGAGQRRAGRLCRRGRFRPAEPGGRGAVPPGRPAGSPPRGEGARGRSSRRLGSGRAGARLGQWRPGGGGGAGGPPAGPAAWRERPQRACPGGGGLPHHPGRRTGRCQYRAGGTGARHPRHRPRGGRGAKHRRTLLAHRRLRGDPRDRVLTGSFRIASGG